MGHVIVVDKCQLNFMFLTKQKKKEDFDKTIKKPGVQRQKNKIIRKKKTGESGLFV